MNDLIEIDNTGFGNCGYYAYAISFMSLLRKKSKDSKDSLEGTLNNLTFSNEEKELVTVLLLTSNSYFYSHQSTRIIETLFLNKLRNLLSEAYAKNVDIEGETLNIVITNELESRWFISDFLPLHTKTEEKEKREIIRAELSNNAKKNRKWATYSDLVMLNEKISNFSGCIDIALNSDHDYDETKINIKNKPWPIISKFSFAPKIFQEGNHWVSLVQKTEDTNLNTEKNQNIIKCCGKLIDHAAKLLLYGESKEKAKIILNVIKPVLELANQQSSSIGSVSSNINQKNILAKHRNFSTLNFFGMRRKTTSAKLIEELETQLSFASKN